MVSPSTIHELQPFEASIMSESQESDDQPLPSSRNNSVHPEANHPLQIPVTAQPDPTEHQGLPQGALSAAL